MTSPNSPSPRSRVSSRPTALDCSWSPDGSSSATSAPTTTSNLLSPGYGGGITGLLSDPLASARSMATAGMLDFDEADTEETRYDDEADDDDADQPEEEIEEEEGDLEPAGATALFIPSLPASAVRSTRGLHDASGNAFIEAQAVALERLLRATSASAAANALASAAAAAAVAAAESPALAMPIPVAGGEPLDTSNLQSLLSARNSQITELLNTATSQARELVDKDQHLDQLEADRAALDQRVRDQVTQIEQFLVTIAAFEEQVTQLEDERDQALAATPSAQLPDSQKQLQLDISSPRNMSISPVAVSSATTSPARRSRPSTPSKLGHSRSNSAVQQGIENEAYVRQLQSQAGQFQRELHAMKQQYAQTCAELERATAHIDELQRASTVDTPIPSSPSHRKNFSAVAQSVPSSPKRSHRSPRFGSTDMTPGKGHARTPSSIDVPLDGPSRRTFLQQSHELYVLRSALADADEAHRLAQDEATRQHEALVQNLNKQLDELCMQNQYFVQELQSLHAQHATELEQEKAQGSQDLAQIQSTHATLTRDIAQQKRTIDKQDLKLAECKFKMDSSAKHQGQLEQSLINARGRAEEAMRKLEATQAEHAELLRAHALLEAAVKELQQHVDETRAKNLAADIEHVLSVIDESDETAAQQQSTLAEAQKQLDFVRREYDLARSSHDPARASQEQLRSKVSELESSLFQARSLSSTSTPLRTHARFISTGSNDLSMLFPQIPHASPVPVLEESPLDTLSPFDGPDDGDDGERSSAPTPFDALLNDSGMVIGSPVSSPIQLLDESRISHFGTPIHARLSMSEPTRPSAALSSSETASMVIENHRLTKALRQAQLDLTACKADLESQLAQCTRLKDSAHEASGAAAISRSQMSALEASLGISNALTKSLEDDVARLEAALSQARQDGYMRQLEAEQRVQDERNKMTQIAMELEELAEALQKKQEQGDSEPERDAIPAFASPKPRRPGVGSAFSPTTRAQVQPSGLLTPQTQKIREIYRLEVGKLRAELDALKQQQQRPSQLDVSLTTHEEVDQLVQTLAKPPPPLILPSPTPSPPASSMPASMSTAVPATRSSTPTSSVDDDLSIVQLRALVRKLRRDVQELGTEKLILQSQFLGLSEQIKKKEATWVTERRELEAALTSTRVTVERIAADVEARAHELQHVKLRNSLLQQQLKLASPVEANAKSAPNSQDAAPAHTLEELSAELETLDASNQSLRSGLAAAVFGRAELEASLRAAQDRLASVVEDLHSSLDRTELLEGQLRQAEHRSQQIQLDHANAEREWVEERRGLLDQITYLEAALKTQQGIVEELRLRRVAATDSTEESQLEDQTSASRQHMTTKQQAMRHRNARHEETTTTSTVSIVSSFTASRNASPMRSRTNSRAPSPAPRKQMHAKTTSIGAGDSLLYAHAATEQQVSVLQQRVSELEEALHHAQVVSASAARDAAVSTEAARAQISDLVAKVTYCQVHHDVSHVSATVAAVEAHEHFRASIAQLESEFAEAIRVEMTHHDQVREAAEERHRTQNDRAKAERIELQATVQLRDEEITRLLQQKRGQPSSADMTMRKEVTSSSHISTNGVTSTSESTASYSEFSRSTTRPNTFLMRSPLGAALMSSSAGQETMRVQQAKQDGTIQSAVASASSAAVEAARSSVATDTAVAIAVSSASATALAQFAPLLDSLQQDKYLLEQTILRHIASLNALEQYSLQLEQKNLQQETQLKNAGVSSLTSTEEKEQVTEAAQVMPAEWPFPTPSPSRFLHPSSSRSSRAASPSPHQPVGRVGTPIRRTPRASPVTVVGTPMRTFQFTRNSSPSSSPRDPFDPAAPVSNDPPMTPLSYLQLTLQKLQQKKANQLKDASNLAPAQSPLGQTPAVVRAPSPSLFGSRSRTIPVRIRGHSPAPFGSPASSNFGSGSPYGGPMPSPIESSAQVARMLAENEALEAAADAVAQARVKAHTRDAKSSHSNTSRPVSSGVVTTVTETIEQTEQRWFARKLASGSPIRATFGQPASAGAALRSPASHSPSSSKSRVQSNKLGGSPKGGVSTDGDATLNEFTPTRMHAGLSRLPQ